MIRKTLMLFMAAALVGCSDDSDPIEPQPDPQLTLSSDSIVVLTGASARVTATVVNSTAAVQFTSLNQSVAQVSATGDITGVNVGTTFVVAVLSGNTAVRDSVRVRVTQESPPPPGAVQLPLLGSGSVPDRYTAEVAVAGQFAYTTSWNTRAAVPGNAVKVWNVAGNVPVLVDSLIIPNAATTGDVQISDDGALLVVAIEFGSDDGIAIYDRTNTPQKPTLIRRFTTEATRQGVHTVKLSRINGRHYAFLSLDPRGGQPAKLSIVDITSPAAPTEVFVRAMGQPYVHDVFVRDGILMTALWHAGLTIWDVGGGGRGGTPGNPIELGTVKTAPCSTCAAGTSYVHNVWWFHDPVTGSKRYAFIGEEAPSNLGGFQSASGAVHVVDVSDFNNPREVAVYEPDPASTWSGQRAGAHNFVGDEPSGVLYAAFYNGGVRALNVRGDLGTCTAAQKTADGRCDLLKMGREAGIGLSNPGVMRFVWGVALSGNRLFASDMPNGLHIVDISALKR